MMHTMSNVDVHPPRAHARHERLSLCVAHRSQCAPIPAHATPFGVHACAGQRARGRGRPRKQAQGLQAAARQ
eukprot:12848359-Alexandrium_andersonii.AAC.1